MQLPVLPNGKHWHVDTNTNAEYFDGEDFTAKTELLVELCGIALIQSHIKNICFDAFADKSVAAEKSVELDDKTFGNMIKEKIDRINAEEKGRECG